MRKKDEPPPKKNWSLAWNYQNILHRHISTPTDTHFNPPSSFAPILKNIFELLFFVCATLKYFRTRITYLKNKADSSLKEWSKLSMEPFPTEPKSAAITGVTDCQQSGSGKVEGEKGGMAIEAKSISARMKDQGKKYRSRQAEAKPPKRICGRERSKNLSRPGPC